MVSIDIPQQYTASPSSHVGTPHLTINKEATIDLDSTNAFEGRDCLWRFGEHALTLFQAPRSS